MITKNPIDKKNCLENIIFFRSARRAFYYLLQQQRFADGRGILIPAYIGITDREGSGVFDPIEEAGINCSFYAVDANLQAEVSDIEEQIRASNIGALLLIHYFGFPQKNIDHLKEVCRRNNIALIEDCAHCLYGKYNGVPLGEHGDFSFYSIHKTLPSDAGGILKINQEAFSCIGLIPGEDNIDKQSLEIFCQAQKSRIEKKRIDNYNHLQQLLSGTEEIRLMNPSLDEGVVPLNMPILVKTGAREPLYFYLMEHHIPTIALYYRLIPEIPKDLFPISYNISENILNLPVHQDIELDDLNRLVQSVNDFFSKNEF